MRMKATWGTNRFTNKNMNDNTEPEMEEMTPQEQLGAMTDPTTSDMSAFKLGDEFDAALIGATITGLYAYSLTRLSMIVMQEMNVHPETAQKMVAKQVIDIMQIHGAESPVFVDDSLMLGFDHRIESELPTEGFTQESLSRSQRRRAHPTSPITLIT